MSSFPVLGIAAWSGVGKTTLLEKIIVKLTARGLRVGVIKHDGHDFEIDGNGKDSARFREAGSVCTLIGSAYKTAMIEMRSRSLWEMLELITDVDIVLVEGFKREPISQIGLCRADSGKDFTKSPEEFVALVTDVPELYSTRPVFSLNDTDGITEFIMQNMEDFTHFNNEGRARMVNVGEKTPSHRSATACVRVLISPETFSLIQSGGMKKGDVLTVAQIAGIMGAKRTPDIIPMCHPVAIHGADLHLELCEERCSVEIHATVECDGKTGVEMEALTAASIAALTVYDMCKAVQKDMVITDLRLLKKSGGVHGDFHREES